jgi:hypothetical protein
MSDLRRRVIAAMLEVAAQRGNRNRMAHEDEVDATIAIALEEAARVSRPPSHMLGSADPYANGYRAACADIAAAIRAMIPSGTIPAQDDTGNAE